MEKITKEFRKGGIYPKSLELITLVKDLDWALWDTTQVGKRAPEWSEIEDRGPVNQFVIGKNYIFAPIPPEGISLRNAVSAARIVKPSLTIIDPSEDRWRTLYVKHGQNRLGIPIPFTRLFFHKEALGASYPASKQDPDPDIVGVDYRYVLDTFKKYFKIAPLSECGPYTFTIHYFDPSVN